MRQLQVIYVRWVPTLGDWYDVIHAFCPRIRIFKRHVYRFTAYSANILRCINLFFVFVKYCSVGAVLVWAGCFGHSVAFPGSFPLFSVSVPLQRGGGKEKTGGCPVFSKTDGWIVINWIFTDTIISHNYIAFYCEFTRWPLFPLLLCCAALTRSCNRSLGLPLFVPNVGNGYTFWLVSPCILAFL